MVLDFISGLAASARRAMANNLFPGFYERGISANKALLELRDMGLGYRRQDFLADFAMGKGTYDQAIRVRFVKPDATPSEGILKPLYHGVPDKYSLVFKATGTDAETGDIRQQYFYYHRNNLDTRSNMEQDALGWMAANSESYGFEIEDVSLTEGYINPVWA